MTPNSNQPRLDQFLTFTLLLLGFYGGIGFFCLMGGNPSVSKLSNATFAEYWQHLDFYMAARMKVYGPILLISVIVSSIILYWKYHKSAFKWMAAAVLVLLLDMIHTFTINIPLNNVIQSWNLSSLPPEVAGIRSRVVDAFWVRSALMIISFGCGLVAFSKRHVPTKNS